jgi:hypothetical protein
LVYL